MANIKLNLPAAPFTGQIVTFPAPCGCDKVTDGLSINGVIYTVVDAMGNCVTGKGGAWSSGALVSVVLDCEGKKAYLQSTTPMLEDWFALGAPLDKNGDNLDTRTTPGKYYLQSSSDISKITGIPEQLKTGGENFELYVSQRTSSSKAQNQLILGSLGSLFLRGKGEKDVWSEWSHKVSDSDLADALAGYIAKADKPSTAYTGDGETTQKTVNVGAASSLNVAVLVRQSESNDFAIVTAAGYIGKMGDTIVCGADVLFAGSTGVLYIKTDNELFNAFQKSYRLSVL